MWPTSTWGCKGGRHRNQKQSGLKTIISPDTPHARRAHIVSGSSPWQYDRFRESNEIGTTTEFQPQNGHRMVPQEQSIHPPDLLRRGISLQLTCPCQAVINKGYRDVSLLEAYSVSQSRVGESNSPVVKWLCKG
eukprot:1194675-Prorocentrum_minimum.AAC.8